MKLFQIIQTQASTPETLNQKVFGKVKHRDANSIAVSGAILVKTSSNEDPVVILLRDGRQ